MDLLDILGYIVRTKPIKVINIANGRKMWKGNLDIELALEMLEISKSFDTVVLVSGDSDFAPVLDKIKRKRKRVLVMSTKDHVSKELVERAKFVDLKKLKRKIEL